MNVVNTVVDALLFFPSMYGRVAQRIVNYPAVPTLRLVSVKEWSAKFDDNVCVQPELRVYNLSCGYVSNGRRQRQPASIAVEKDTGRIYWPHTTSSLFGQGTDESLLGQMVLSLPFLMFAAPALFAATTALNKYEEVSGMNRYGARILTSIQNQLLPEDLQQLTIAFKQMG